MRPEGPESVFALEGLMRPAAERKLEGSPDAWGESTEGRGEGQHIGFRNKWGMTLFLLLKSCPQSVSKNVWNEHHVVTKQPRHDPSQES